jgi:hypothetical protein
MPESYNHDPTTRELLAEIKALRAIVDERHERYRERFEAQKEAILKAESAQKDYNIQHNDLSRTMKEQYQTMLPRSEATLKWEAIDNDLASLRESRSEGSGKSEGGHALWGYIIAAISLLLAGGSLLLRR